MKYNIFINQRAVIENGLDKQLDLVDLALFDLVYGMMNSIEIPKTLINSVEYIQVKQAYVSSQSPLLGINNRETLRRRMLKLVDAGLLIRYEKNQEEGQSLYARGDKFSILVFHSGQSGALPMNNGTLPIDTGTTLQQPMVPPANDCLHNNNISTNNNINNNNTNSQKEKKKELDLSFVNIAFLDTFKEWLEYKKGKGQSYKDQHSLEVCYRNLLKFSNGDPHTAQQIIDEAMGNNYAGFFQPKQQQNYGSSSTSTPSRAKQLAAELKQQGFVF